jgi:capsular exopolysaccharide synthesis family protein
MIDRREAVPEEVTLQQYIDVLRRRRWTIINTAIAVFILGCIATALMTPIYQAQSKLLVRAAAPQLSVVNTENPFVDLLAMAQPESVDTQIEVLRSGPFIDEVLKATHAPQGKREPHVRVDGVRDTNVIAVKVESPDPKMAAQVANTMLSHYLDRTTVLSLQEITKAREFVQREAEKSRLALQDAENTLSEFRRKNRVAELTAEQQSRTQQFVDLESKSRETDANIARIRAEMRDVKAQLAHTSQDRIDTAGHANPRVDALQAQMAEATVERATLLKSYRPAHLKIRTIDASIENLKAQLAAEPAELRVPLHVHNDRYDKLQDRLDGYQQDLDGFLAQQAAVEPQLALARERTNQLGLWEVRLNQLQRDRDMAEKTYLNLKSRLEDLQIRENARRSTARIIEHAGVPGSPVRPRRTTNMAVSLVLGLLLGGCLAFLLETLDDRITTDEEVDRLIALPVLGHIPTMASEDRLISTLPSHSHVCESYRGLRSSISFSGIDTPLTTLGVSSARAGEGKTTTAINLALAMAMDGREVILVDTDLRRPSLHKQLSLSASPGLTDVLTGNSSLEEALQPLPEQRLLVLTSGPVPPNPAEMLNTEAMAGVIQQLRGMADVVVFDSPPCLPVTDAQVLGAKLDGMVLIAEMGEARKAEVRRARELLDQAHIRVLGVVLNKLSSQNGGYYYRYGYYRGEYASNGHRNGSSGNGSGHAGPVRVPRLAGHRGGEVRSGPSAPEEGE